MTWKPDTRHVKTYGDLTLTPERQGQETAHRIDIPGGLSVRAVPDGQTSGRKRSHVVSKALTELGMMDPPPSYDLAANYLLGQLALSGLTWEWCDLATEAREAVTIEEWLTHWMEAEGHPVTGDIAASRLLADLSSDGWQIVRAS